MSNSTVNYISRLLTSRGITAINDKELNDFVDSEEIKEKVTSILNTQEAIMDKWVVRSRIIDFKNESIIIPNGTVNTKYSHAFNQNFLSDKHVSKFIFSSIEELGLIFNNETHTIEGVPNKSGTFKLKAFFKVEGESETEELNIKEISFVINPDPKSLWKDIPSDKEAIFWKEDDQSQSGKLGEKSVVISSKRGRSHKNVGSFRDDDFAFKTFKDSGWSIVAVSDGAGSASFSRKGSEVACQETIKFFEENILANNELDSFEEKVKVFAETKDEIALEEAKIAAKKTMYKAVIHVHEQLQKLAGKTFDEHPEMFKDDNKLKSIESFHATLVFTAFKKLDIGYAFLSFGVGDCPIGLINEEGTTSNLLNWLDVGEFGGGTRFITQRDIFHSKERPMSSRFNIHFQKDFSYLFLMSDGIYDPKFEVEANLEKSEKWIEFIQDLKGRNQEDTVVDFEEPLEQVEVQLNKWMDFWSKGNHDDRTLAIIY